MNKRFLLIILLITTSPLMALVGVCCEYGANPKKPSAYNYQERQFIECYCDCADTMKPCPKCEHSREPRFKQYIANQKDNVKKLSSRLFCQTKTMQEAISLFVKKHKHIISHQ